MMNRSVYRRSAVALAAALLLVPLPGAALAPVIALLVKQMVQQSVTSMVKDTLLGSLRGMGCKGIALSNAITALDARGGGRALAGGLPGMAATGGLAAMPNMPTMPNMPNMPPGVTLPGGAPNVGAIAGVPPGAAGPLGDEMMRKMQSMQSMQPGMALDPSQMAMMAQAQSMLSQPTSPAETLSTIDEMAEIGLLPKPMQTELKECMTLLPQAAPAMGMAMGMLRPVLPKMREAREQMQALSPDEQDEMAATIAKELQSVSADDRKAFVESLGGGFFPPRVSAGVKARLGAK